MPLLEENTLDQAKDDTKFWRADFIDVDKNRVTKSIHNFWQNPNMPWQQLKISSSSKSDFKLLDETGIVLGLQSNMVSPLARQIAERKQGRYERLFKIAEVFKL